MELLWVIIIVGAIFFRIFGKLTNLQEKIPGEWKDKVPREWRETGLPPVFRELGFPWEDEEEASQAPVPARTKQLTEWQQDEVEAEVPAAVPEPVPVLPQPAAAGSGQAGYSLPVMDKQLFLNGIIFGELLQPPRCKRGKRR